MLGSIKIRFIVGKLKMGATTKLRLLQRSQEVHLTVFAMSLRGMVRVSKNRPDRF